MNELKKYEAQPVAVPPMTVDEVKNQVALIQTVLRSVMKEGEHYGKIPGCGDKPALLKPGAEKLSLTFRMAPTYEITERELPGGHREFRITCSLHHITSGNLLGQGVGSASSMESKWRFRSENTGEPVPKEYWDNRDVELLGGPAFSSRKTKDGWMIFHRVEHDNPADMFNTVLKMAKKRAHVDACLTATAASDIFTQDIEEIEQNEEAASGHGQPPKPKPANAPAKQTPAPAGETTCEAMMVDVRTKTGQSAKGQWTAHFFTFEDENRTQIEAGTFDTRLGEAWAMLKGQQVTLTYQPGRKPGSFELLDVKPVADNEEGAYTEQQ